MGGIYLADSFYWIASVHAKDNWHSRVLAWGRSHPTARLVTTEEILTEVLNWFAAAGPSGRTLAAHAVRNVIADASIQILPQTTNDFHSALALYESRLDKDYSLTDCRSMVALREMGISEVLTNDHHFTQEGFTILFP
jgi:predicted nucleic acid-binding protein